MRTTVSMAEQAVERLAKTLGVPYQPKAGESWGIFLDYSPGYGGATIGEWVEADSGEWYAVSHPTGGMMNADRRPLGEFVRTVDFAIRMIERFK